MRLNIWYIYRRVGGYTCHFWKSIPVSKGITTHGYYVSRYPSGTGTLRRVPGYFNTHGMPWALISARLQPSLICSRLRDDDERERLCHEQGSKHVGSSEARFGWTYNANPKYTIYDISVDTRKASDADPSCWKWRSWRCCIQKLRWSKLVGALAGLSF